MTRFIKGQGVSWNAGTDTRAGTVWSVAPNVIHVVEDVARLLNGPDSNEPDKLQFSPGGFCGHMSGEQRYEYAPGDGRPIAFTLRKNGEYKLLGTSISGSMSAWGWLTDCRHKHHDYNF